MKTLYNIIVARDRNDQTIGYGIINAETWVNWKLGKAAQEIKHASDFLFGGSDLVDTYSEWAGVDQAIKDMDGQICSLHTTVYLG